MRRTVQTLALLLTLTPVLRFMGWLLGSLFHETGHVAFAWFVRAVISIALFTSVSSMVMVGPRVYAKMADDGFFPSWFRFRDRPPVQAIWFQAVLAIIAIRISTLKELLGYLGLTLSICSALTVAMLFVLRWRHEKIDLPFWGIPPAIYVMSTLILAVLYAVGEPGQAMAAAITVLAGFLLYPFIGNSRRTT